MLAESQVYVSLCLQRGSCLSPVPTLSQREGGTLSCAPSAVTDAGNGAPLNWRPSADAVAGNGGTLSCTPSAVTDAGNGPPLNWRPSADAVAGRGTGG